MIARPGQEMLASLPMFRRLAPADLEKLAALSEIGHYARGATLFREGDEPTHFHVVVAGRVKIAKSTPAGRDVILEVFGPGDPIGAVAVFEGFPYPATATALADADCLEIRRDVFFAALERHPSITRGVLSGLALRLVELTHRISELSGGRVEARMARLFQKLAEEKGVRRADGVFVPLPLTRQELADLCGTTVETAIRIMSRWGKEGIVRTERDGFLLLKPDAVAELALS